MIRYRASLSALLTTLVLMGLLAAPAKAQDATPGLFAFAQFIHNVPDAGPVDVYVNDVLTVDNLAFQNATAFAPLLCPNTCKATIDVVPGDDPDNSNPVFTADAILDADVYYGAVAVGVLSQAVFEVLAIDYMRTESKAPGKVEYLLVHGVPGAEVDVLLLDENGECDPVEPATCFLLTNNWTFGEVEGYWQLEPRLNYFGVLTADGSTPLLRLGFDVTGFKDKAITVVASPINDSTFTLLAFDGDGNKLEGTPTPTPRTLEFDTEGTKVLAVDGNYPNPFNPSTSIRFNLAEPAQVRLDVIDVLGRTVLSQPARRFEAGVGHTFSVNASALASGIYLYRVTALTGAQTLTHTGRMILSK